MKIVHISTVHGAFDDRIFYKECVSLANSGYDTHLIVPHTKNETISGVKIHSIAKHSNRIDRVIKGNKEAGKVAFDLNADVYHLHDPELLPLGLKLKKKGKKVIFDMHELVYHTIMQKDWIPFLFRWIVSRAYLYFEKKAFKTFDHFIVVTSQMKDEYIANSYPKQLKNTSVIRNLTILKMVDDALPIKKLGQETILIYAGGLSPSRGLKEVILAIQNIENVKFWLLGPWSSSGYQKECEQADINHKVDYKGMVRLDKVYNYMKAADIGMAVLHPTTNHLASLPVKSFEYMASKIPQIMSDFPFWQESFGDCALFVKFDNIESISTAINDLVNNPGIAKEIGSKGYEMIKNEFSWEQEAAQLIDIYKNLKA